MKKGFRVAICALALLTLMCAASCQKKQETSFTSLAAGDVTYTPTEEVTNYVCIQMDTGKNILVELYPDTAPITVENFKKLVSQNFYDGLIFHRVIPGFMIQGGCPDGTGMGDPGWEIKGEFAANGVKNDLSHSRGVLSMARGNDPDSAGSQFFICHSTAGCSHLDGQYATFGRVLSGMDVVDEIATTPCSGSTPVERQVMEKVFFVKPDVSAPGNKGEADSEKKTETKTEVKTEDKTPAAPADDFATNEGKKYTVSAEKTDYVCIRMSDGKRIVVQLYPDTAPITVENFQKLVSQNFYDGLIFHRVIPGFMIQGGCPEGNGMGGPGWTIKGEFSSNGVKNDLLHTRGVISMARAMAPDSGGSQFFIMHADAPHLNGEYAAFGKVVEGMDTVDAIASTDCNGESPVQKQIMERVYFVTPESK